MDARQLRTRARLARAILDLAATKPVSDITVSELASKAEINRSTFYEHSDSPTALLRSVLREELDEIRHRHLDSVDDVAASVRAVTLAVLAHVDAHETIYVRSLGDDNASELHSMLSAHFESTMHTLFDTGAIVPPTAGDPALAKATAARFIADGTVGAIDVWIHSPAPRDAEKFLAAYLAVMPAWWPLS